MNTVSVIRSKKNILFFLFSFFSVARIFGGYLGSNYWTFLFLLSGFVSLFLGLKSYKIKVDSIGMFLVLYLFINVIITDPPSAFQSEWRLLIFIFLLFLVSPILQNRFFWSLRHKSFEYVMILFVAISFLSFFCYFLGINWMIDQTTDNDFYESYTVTEGAGHFGGITNHSMTLGFISGIAICYLLFKYFSTKHRRYVFFIICCLGTLMFASSRVALGATIISYLVYIFKHTKTRLGFIKTLISIVVVITLSVPIWIGAMAGIIAKQNTKGDLSDMGGRAVQIESRIEEFVNEPIMGMGFASVDPQKSTVGESGQIEPGSSWLTVLSMTGIVGFMIVVALVVKSCKSLNYVKDDEKRALLSSLVAFFVVHLLVEGYIFSGGSTLCFTFWLIMGVSRDYRFKYVYIPKDGMS